MHIIINQERALKIIDSIDESATGDYYLRCERVADNGVKYLYSFSEYWREDNSRSAADFINEVATCSYFWLTTYDDNNVMLTSYQLIE